MGKFDAFQQKMQDAGLNQAAIDAFRLNYEQLEQGVTGLVRYQRCCMCLWAYPLCSWDIPAQAMSLDDEATGTTNEYKHMLLKCQFALKDQTAIHRSHPWWCAATLQPCMADVTQQMVSSLASISTLKAATVCLPSACPVLPVHPHDRCRWRRKTLRPSPASPSSLS